MRLDVVWNHCKLAISTNDDLKILEVYEQTLKSVHGVLAVEQRVCPDVSVGGLAWAQLHRPLSQNFRDPCRDGAVTHDGVER